MQVDSLLTQDAVDTVVVSPTPRASSPLRHSWGHTGPWTPPPEDAADWGSLRTVHHFVLEDERHQVNDVTCL